jgi:hypothetical protein
MLAMEQPAYAYIDLGTGSMIFQVAIATVVAALAGLKIRWHRLKQKVKGVGEQPDSKGTVGD